MQEKSFEDKFNELAVFFNAAAHELRTPVTTGKIYIQLLLESMRNQGDLTAVANLSKAEAQLNKLNLLISNVLDVSRMHANKFNVITEPTDVNEAVHSAIAAKENTLARHSLQFTGELTSKAEANRDRIIQVVSNLIDNAVKFSSAKSTIQIELFEDLTNVFISVRDEGKGISETNLPKIFDEDLRKDQKEKQSGLGISLFVSKAIIEKMGGRLTVESKEGAGAKFTVQLQKAANGS